MSTKQNCTIKLYVYLSGVWTDITADTINNYSLRWGINGASATDRLASTGSLKFSLNNKTGKYAPGNASALAGWKKGVFAKLVITYDSVDYVRFYGQIDTLEYELDPNIGKRVYVTALDWLDYAAKYPLISPAYAANKRADEALTVIVGAMPIQPISTAYDTGDNTFPAMFDTVTTKTRAYTEFGKLALSEMGYIYLLKTKTNGEQLVFEKNTHRSGLSEIKTIPTITADSGKLLTENNDILLLEDGGKIVLDELEPVYIYNNAVLANITYGKQLVNRVAATVYPKKVDTSAQVLYSLSSPLAIGASQTINYRGNYTDPSGGAIVNAVSSSMIAPVATTDYTMNTASNGSGTDITAYLTVSVTYGTEGPIYTLKNTYDLASTAYITKLQARGYGIYQYNPIESITDDSVSYNEYGYKIETIQQQYQREIRFALREGEKVLNREKQPRTTLDKITMIANSSSFLMQAMLNVDVGDLVHVREDTSGIDGYYWVHGVDVNIASDKNISYGWNMRQHFSLNNGYTLIGTEFYNAHSTDVLNFGYQPTIANQTYRCNMGWIKISASTGKAQSIVRMGGRYGFYYGIYTGAGVGTNGISFLRGYDNTFGIWHSTGTTLSTGTWYHVAVVRDESVLSNSPLFYVNGVLQTTVADTSPVGNMLDITGWDFTLGNIYDNARPFDGQMKDVRIYDRILTASEILQIYNDGAGGTGVTDGLIFQGPCVNSSDLSYYTNHTLLSTDRVIDNIYGAIGKPDGSPVTRLI